MEIADSGEGWMRIGIKSIEYSGKYFEAENPQKRLDAVFIGNTRVLNVRLENLRRSYNKLLAELSYLPVDRETLSQCMFVNLRVFPINGRESKMILTKIFD